MSIDIKLHKKDLPDDFEVSNTIAVDCEMGGLNVNRDPLFLVQISSGNSDAHIIQLNRENLSNFVFPASNCVIAIWNQNDI